MIRSDAPFVSGGSQPLSAAPAKLALGFGDKEAADVRTSRSGCGGGAGVVGV
jgi:hypothetical protein